MLHSSLETNNVDSTLVPLNTNLTTIFEEHNRWCVYDQGKIYRDARMINEK